MGKLKLFLSMAKVGIIGFGGGNALIPVIQKEVVEDKKLITEEEYEEDVLVASITPGALPVEIAGGVGRRIAGWKGAFCGALGMALPGVLLAVLLISLMSNINETIATQISFVTIGITAYIASLLTEYIIKTVKSAGKGYAIWYLCITSVVFLLTCGKKLYTLMGVEGKPMVVLSAIHIFIIAFGIILFISFFTKGDKNDIKKASISKIEVISMIKEIFLFIIILAAFMIPAVLLVSGSVRYSINVFISSVLSFGGGDAYLTVADGLFVDAKLVSEVVFYGNIVPLVNLIPGSILCKTVSCIGYIIGYSISGNILCGYLVAAAGFLCSLLASYGVFAVARFIYKGFGELKVFMLIKRWIRPIVSGLMVTVVLSLIVQVKKIGVSENIGITAVVVFGFVYFMNIVMCYKVKCGSLVRMFMSFVLAVFVCNFM